MTTAAAIPLDFELPHVLMLVWLLAGCFALWVAKRLQLPRHKSVNILLPMALGLMVFALYLGTRFNYDFLIDDVDIVQTNPDVVEADGWRTLWAHDYWAGRSTDDNLYRPVTILSYWVNARLPLCGRIVDGRAEEMYPRYFRGVNLVLLTGLAWLIAVWLNCYVQQTAAWTVAFLFAGHAVHAEMVNYIVCRADLLAMIGVVGFLYLQRLAIEAGRWRWWSAALALFSALVAVGSKESGLILLPAALVQAWIGPRHADTEITDDIPRAPLPVTAGWIALLAVPLMLFAIGRLSAVGAGVDYTGQFMDDLRDNPLRTLSFAERIPAVPAIAWFYFKQIFVPNTSYYHIPVELPQWGSAETIRGITLIVVLALLVVSYIKGRRWQVLAITIALGQFLLVGNLLTPVGVYAANRLILPFSLAAAILGAGLIHWFCGLSPRRRAVVILPTLAVITVMAVAIQEVNHVWRTEARLMGRDLQLAPAHPVAMYNFGTVRAREAVFVDKYIRALTLGIDLASKIESQVNHPAESFASTFTPAVEQLRRELKGLDDTQQQRDHVQNLRDMVGLLDRTFVQGLAVLTHDDIASASKTLREDLDRDSALSRQYWSEAIAMLRQVVVARPDSLSGRIELARTLRLRNQTLDSLKEYSEIVKRSKNETDLRVIEAHIRYGVLCVELRLGPLKEEAEKNLVVAELSLASLLSKDDKLRPAERDQLHALNREAKRYLGIVAQQAGHLQLALKRHDRLLLQYPDFQEAIEDKRQWIDQLTPRDSNPPPGSERDPASKP